MTDYDCIYSRRASKAPPVSGESTPSTHKARAMSNKIQKLLRADRPPRSFPWRAARYGCEKRDDDVYGKEKTVGIKSKTSNQAKECARAQVKTHS